MYTAGSSSYSVIQENLRCSRSCVDGAGYLLDLGVRACCGTSTATFEGCAIDEAPPVFLAIRRTSRVGWIRFKSVEPILTTPSAASCLTDCCWCSSVTSNLCYLRLTERFFPEPHLLGGSSALAPTSPLPSRPMCRFRLYPLKEKTSMLFLCEICLRSVMLSAV